MPRRLIFLLMLNIIISNSSFFSINAAAKIVSQSSIEQGTKRFLFDLLFKAIQANDKALIAELLNSNIDLNARLEETGYTPLTFTIARTHGWDFEFEIVEKLIAAGANVNATNIHKATPLMIAAHQGLDNIVKFLLSKGAHVNIIDAQGRSALRLSIENTVNLWEKDPTEFDNGISFKLLIDAGAYIYPEILLTAAKKNIPIDVIKILIENGADINAEGDGRRQTPLMEAAIVGNKEVVELLLKAGSILNRSDVNGCDAIWYANHIDTEDDEVYEDLEDTNQELYEKFIKNKKEIVKMINDEPARRTNVIESCQKSLATKINKVTSGQLPNVLCSLIAQTTIVTYDDVVELEKLNKILDWQDYITKRIKSVFNTNPLIGNLSALISEYVVGTYAEACKLERNNKAEALEIESFKLKQDALFSPKKRMSGNIDIDDKKVQLAAQVFQTIMLNLSRKIKNLNDEMDTLLKNSTSNDIKKIDQISEEIDKINQQIITYWEMQNSAQKSK